MKNNPKTGLYHSPYVLLTLAVFFWSGNFIVGRAVRADIMPIALSFWRWSGASLLVFWLAWPHLKSDAAAIKRNWPILLLLAVIGIAVFFGLIEMIARFVPPVFEAFLSHAVCADIVNPEYAGIELVDDLPALDIAELGPHGAL